MEQDRNNQPEQPHLSPREIEQIRLQRQAELQAGAQEISRQVEGHARLRDMANRPSLPEWPEPAPDKALGGRLAQPSEPDLPIRDQAELEEILSRGMEGTGEDDPHKLTGEIEKLMGE